MNSASGDPTWSVEFIVRDDERVALDYAGPRVVGPEGYSVIRPWADDEAPSRLTINVGAPSASAAEEAARERYRQMREMAELVPDRVPQVSMIARVVGRPHPWDRHVFAAGEMLRQGQYALAVVAAQIHCEMFVRHAVNRAAQHDGSRTAVAVSDLLHAATLVDRHGAAIFETLLDARPSAAPNWDAYRRHLTRRNEVVHQGAEVTAEEANASITAAVEMVRFVDDCLRARLREPATAG